jgi:hypothetical protein
MPAQRPLRRPVPDFADLVLPVTSYPARALWRVHARDASAIHFGLHPGHRFSHPECAVGVLYLAESPATCLWERFGDDVLNPDARVSLALWITRALSQVQVPDLRLCDLTDDRTRSRAKVDVSALIHPDLSIPQAWGLAIQRHPAGFDGLRYRSRFNQEPCVALFGRQSVVSRLGEARVADLVDAPEAEEFLSRHQVALV